jgi:acyl carrier protein
MSEGIEERLAEVFRAVLRLPPGSNVEDLRPEEAEGWDSLGHVSLMAAIANEFEIRITPLESLEVTSFGAASALVDTKTRGSG